MGDHVSRDSATHNPQKNVYAVEGLLKGYGWETLGVRMTKTGAEALMRGTLRPLATYDELRIVQLDTHNPRVVS